MLRAWVMLKLRRFGWTGGRNDQNKKKSEAYAELVLRVEDLQLVHLHSCDPKIIWDTLAQVHQVWGLATWLVLHRKFLTSVKGAEETMSAWIGQMKALSYRLEDIGVDVLKRIPFLHSQWDLIFHMICSSFCLIPCQPISLISMLSFCVCIVRKCNGRILEFREWGLIKREDQGNEALNATKMDGLSVC